MKVGQYCIMANRGLFRIRQCYAKNENVTCFIDAPNERVYSISEREAALKRAYELNGWRWPPRPRPSR